VCKLLTRALSTLFSLGHVSCFRSRAAEAIRSFQEQHADLVSVAQLEMALPVDVDPAKLNDAATLVADLKVQTFLETATLKAGASKSPDRPLSTDFVHWRVF
jgi:hypothetical protein